MELNKTDKYRKKFAQEVLNLLLIKEAICIVGENEFTKVYLNSGIPPPGFEISPQYPRIQDNFVYLHFHLPYQK